jgi:hypothetical protein
VGGWFALPANARHPRRHPRTGPRPPLREAPAGTFPQIAALGAELMSGAGPDRLIWGFNVLISGITQTPRPEETGPREYPEPPGS